MNTKAEATALWPIEIEKGNSDKWEREKKGEGEGRRKRGRGKGKLQTLR